jgi:hypothetical protein
VVVRQHGSSDRRRIRQVAGRAQEVARAGRGVEDVVRVGHAVAVAVLAPIAPRAGQELHRADRAIPGRVAVPGAAVAVGYHRVTGGRPVQRDAHYAAAGVAVGVDPSAVCVARLDPPDPRQEPPRQMAGRLGRRQVGLRLAVGGQHADGYAGRPVGHSGTPGQRVGSIGLDGRRVDGRRAWSASIGAAWVRGRRPGRRRPRHELTLRSTVVERGSLHACALEQQHRRGGLWGRGLGASRIRNRHCSRQGERTQAADEEGGEHDGPGGARGRHAVRDPESAGRELLDRRDRGWNGRRPVRDPDHSQPPHRRPCRFSSPGGLPHPALTRRSPRSTVTTVRRDREVR